MHYCATHRRALQPESYDCAQHRGIPAHWRPVDPSLPGGRS